MRLYLRSLVALVDLAAAAAEYVLERLPGRWVK